MSTDSTDAMLLAKSGCTRQEFTDAMRRVAQAARDVAEAAGSDPALSPDAARWTPEDDAR